MIKLIVQLNTARQSSKHCYMRSDNCSFHAIMINLE